MRRDKEAGYAGDSADIFAGFLRRFQTIDISLCNFYVGFLGKQQSNVDVDAFTDQLADRGHALRRVPEL